VTLTTFVRAGWLTSACAALLLGGSLRTAFEDLGGSPRFLLGGLSAISVGAGLGLLLGGRDRRWVPLLSLALVLGLVYGATTFGEPGALAAGLALGFGASRLRVGSGWRPMDAIAFALAAPMGWLVPPLALLALGVAVLRLRGAPSSHSTPVPATPAGSSAAVISLGICAFSGTGALVAARGTLDPTPLGLVGPVAAAMLVAAGASTVRLRPGLAAALGLATAPATLVVLAAVPHRADVWLLPLAGAEDPRAIALAMLAATTLPAATLGGLAWRSLGPRVRARGLALLALGAGGLLGVDAGPDLRDQLLLATTGLAVLLVVAAPSWGDKGLSVLGLAAAAGVVLVPLPWPEVELTRGQIYLLRTSEAPGQEELLVSSLQAAVGGWGPDGSKLVETADGRFARVLIDGLDHRPDSRSYKAARLAGHLGPTLSRRRAHAAVLGEALGGTTAALVIQEVEQTDVVVANRDLILALHESDEAMTAAYLHPSVRLVPEANELYLRQTSELDILIELASTTWSDAHQGLPGARQLRRRRDALAEGGVYVLTLPLSWMTEPELRGLLSEADSVFAEVRLLLPPEGADHLLLAAWSGPVDVQWEQVVRSAELGRVELLELSILSPLDLADRALVDSDGVRALASSGGSAPRWHLTPVVFQRPVLLASLLSEHVVEPTFYAGLDPEVEAALAARAETNRCLLRVLSSSTTGDVPGLFEGGRCLDERALDPLIEPYLTRAREAIEQGQREGPNSLAWRTCLTQTRAALWMHPRSAEALALAGRCGLVVDRRRAKEDFEAALVLDPDHLDALLGLAQLQFAREQIDEALETLAHAVQVHPLVWRPHHHLGALLMELGRNDEALVELDKARGLAGDESTLPSSALAELYLQLGRPNDAIFYAKSAAQRTPSAKNLDLLGRSYLGVDQLSAAEREYRRAVLKDPDYWQAHTGLALARAGQGDLEGAISSLERALELDPGNGRTRQLLEDYRARSTP
jgi:Flp pilus assembly protein TadD